MSINSIDHQDLTDKYQRKPIAREGRNPHIKRQEETKRLIEEKMEQKQFERIWGEL